MANKKIKGITIEIGGNTTQLGKALEDVEKKSGHLKTELSSVNRLLKFDSSNTEILKQKQDILVKSIASTEEKLKKLKETQSQVQEQFEKGEIGEEQYRAFQREIIATENKLKSLTNELKTFGSVGKQEILAVSEKMQKASNSVEAAGQKLKKASTVATVGLGASAKIAIDFESAFAGVEKTVDGTARQMSELKQGIRDMAKEMPSSTTEISAVAEAAGQLGIKTENILSFSKAMIDLGNSTNLTSDEAASQLAKFANVMQMSQEDFNKLGSAIVDLGNNYATTEADIVNMSMRLAGAGAQVGLSEGQVLGLATALSSVGIEAEMGGSAISKAMVKMQNAVEQGGTKLNDVLSKTGLTLRELELLAANDSKSFKDMCQSIGMTSTEVKQLITAGTNLEDFAKISGMTAEQFKKSWKEDAAGALTSFIKGLGDAENKGESAITMLSEMGLTEVRLRDSLLRAANAGTLFNDAINTGTKAWEENNALTNEANKRYETTASKMKISVNKIKDIGISLGSNLLPKVEKALSTIDKGVQKFDKLDSKTQKFIVTTGLLVAASSPLLNATGKLISGGSAILRLLPDILTPTGALITALGVLAGTIAVVSLNSNKMSEETQKSIDATKSMVEEQNRLTESLKENQKLREEAIKKATVECGTVDILYKKLIDLEGIENKTNAQKELMATLVSKLNEMMPNLNLEYDKEKDKLNQTTEAIKNQIESQKELLKAKAAQSQLTSVAADIVKAEMAVQEATKQTAKAQGDYNEAVRKRKELEEKYKNNPWRGTKDFEELRKVEKEEKNLKKALDESNNSLNQQKENLKNLNNEYSNTQKYAENAFSQAEIISKFEKISDAAKKVGKDIPEALVNGMKDGSIAIPDELDQLNNLISFENKITELGLEGEKIPYAISQGIITGQYTVDTAIQQLQETIDFRNAENKAEISGVAIPDKLREGLINGEISLKEANDLVNSWINFEKAHQSSIDAGMQIPENIRNGILNGELSIEDANNQMNNWVEFSKAVQTAKEAGVAVPDGLVENALNGEINVQNATGVLKEAISKQLETTDQIGLDAGGNLAEGINKGIENKKGSVFDKIANFGKSILNKLKESLQEHSPSKASEEDAEFLLEGINIGVNKNKQKVFNTISNFGKETLKKLNNELTKGSEFETGINLSRNIMLNSSAGTSIKDSKDSGNINKSSNVQNTFNIYNPEYETASESVRRIRKDAQFQNLLNGNG